MLYHVISCYIYYIPIVMGDIKRLSYRSGAHIVGLLGEWRQNGHDPWIFDPPVMVGLDPSQMAREMGSEAVNIGRRICGSTNSKAATCRWVLWFACLIGNPYCTSSSPMRWCQHYHWGHRQSWWVCGRVCVCARADHNSQLVSQLVIHLAVWRIEQNYWILIVHLSELKIILLILWCQTGLGIDDAVNWWYYAIPKRSENGSYAGSSIFGDRTSNMFDIPVVPSHSVRDSTHLASGLYCHIYKLAVKWWYYQDWIQGIVLRTICIHLLFHWDGPGPWSPGIQGTPSMGVHRA